MTVRKTRGRWAVSRGAARQTAAAALLAGLLLAPEAAHAHKCDRTDNDRREASRVIRDLTGEIDAMERAIIEALRLQTGQLSGYIAQSAKAVTGALDSQTRLQAQTAREVAETGSMLAHRPSRSACEAVTGLRGLAGTGAAAESAHARAVRDGDRPHRGRPRRGRPAGRRRRRRGPLPDGDKRILQRGPRRRGIRSLPGRGRAARRRSQGGDALRPAHLRKPRRSCARPSSSRATWPCRWCTTRLRSPPQTPTGSAGACCSHVPADARAALAADYLAQARALRAPGAALGGWAAEIARDAGRDPELPVSRYELLELLASGRFEDPNWFVGLQAMSAENLLRELVTLQAVSLMLGLAALPKRRAARRHRRRLPRAGHGGDAPPARPRQPRGRRQLKPCARSPARVSASCSRPSSAARSRTRCARRRCCVR